MGMIMSKKRIIISIAVVMLCIGIWTVWGNTALELNTYTIDSSKLPSSFNGYRIAHVSDLHNTEMGQNNEKLLKMIKSAEPDIIVITGDMIDSRNTKVDVALNFAAEAVKIAPCYFVKGNHEVRVTEYEELRNGLIDLGVIVLEDEKNEIEKQGEEIVIVGVDDPSAQNDYLFDDSQLLMDSKLKTLKEDYSFTVLLSHRPELFDVYVDNDINLVFSGHAHGGQFRLPFIGGMIAPHQGLLPEYDSGIYTEENTNMVVSRGIGNSLFPFRFNNRPEIILIELQRR
ncbi:MAG: metallophosphoesterase [Firmicutes bacterium]|nr:metallophosphoesterase [Bacillota bacterium]